MGIGIRESNNANELNNENKQNSEKPKNIEVGLGLLIVKIITVKIVKKIQFESLTNKNTKFFFVVENRTQMKKASSIFRDDISDNFRFKKNILSSTIKSYESSRFGQLLMIRKEPRILRWKTWTSNIISYKKL